jgi:hypothetical protein
MKSPIFFVLSLLALACTSCSPKMDPLDEPYAWQQIDVGPASQRLEFIEHRIQRVELQIEEQENLQARYFYTSSFYQRRVKEKLASLYEELRALKAEKNKLLGA